MSVRIRIIETVPTKAHRRIPALARLRRRMIKLQNLREQGTPDRIGEEDLLNEMERSPSVSKTFWEKGGYQWAG